MYPGRYLKKNKTVRKKNAVLMMGERITAFDRINFCYGNNIFKILELFSLMCDSVGKRKSDF